MSREAVLAASVVVGIAVPPLAHLLSPYLYGFVFFLMLFSSLTIRLADAWPDREGGGRLAGILAVQMLALPIVIGLWHLLVPATRHWSELALITACAGTIFGAPAFARVMGLDATLTLRGVIAGTLMMPVVLPLLVPIITGRSGEFDFLLYLLRLCLFILVPLAAAYWYQRRFDGGRRQWNRLFSGLTIVSLALFGIAIMDGIGPMFVAAPVSMIGLLAFALGIHALFFGLSALLFGRWGRRDALTAGLLSGYRNLGVVLAVGGGLLPPGFIIFAALWQIPMYLAPLAVRLRHPARRQEL